MKILGIIPSRYASTRFPGKPLAIIDGKSMIQRVYEQASKADTLTKVVVATDDLRIFRHIQGFGGEVVMTAETHQNGTSRCREVLTKSSENFDAVINIQGDEPFINPQQINQLARLFQNADVQIGTLVKKIQSKEELFNPNVVKVVFGNHQKALLFSRQAIPFLRGEKQQEWLQKQDYYKHIGIYGYRFDVLEKIVKLTPTPLEQAEKLEQLRWLENDFPIHLQNTNFEGISIDTPEDLLKLTNKT